MSRGSKELQLWIDKNRITKTDFAKQIPCSPALVTGWTGGYINPSYRMARRISTVTGGDVPVSLFFPDFSGEYNVEFE